MFVHSRPGKGHAHMAYTYTPDGGSAGAKSDVYDCLIIIRPHRHTTDVDAAYCYRPSSMVCLSVTVVSPAKTAELIEMLFGLRTRVAQGTMY